jgi:hypothetical protein
MSKIFEAIKRAELIRSGPKDSGITELPNRRRTDRTHVQIPLFIYGYTLGEVPFYEGACTSVINANGGLMSMRSRVRPGQHLLVTNEGNEQTQEGIVVSVRVQRPGNVHVAFKFLSSTPQFWCNLEIGKRADLSPSI